MSLRLRRDDTLRLFAGQCDSQDPTAFHIRYELNGAPGVLTVRLRDNGQFEWKVAAGSLDLPK